jgi:hypothetical protein
MPTYQRHFVRGQLQFLTSSTYRRARLFESEQFHWTFIEVCSHGTVVVQWGFAFLRHHEPTA